MSHMLERNTLAGSKLRGHRSFMKIRLQVAAGKRLFAAVLFLGCAGMANAALIEISRTPPDRSLGNGRANPLPFWQDHYHRQNGYGVLPAVADALGRQTYGATHLRNAGAHFLRTLDGGPMPNPDLYAAIDAPYVAVDASVPSGDTDPELWAMLLVATGLIGYQIRRRSRLGAIRIRPLRF